MNSNKMQSCLVVPPHKNEYIAKFDNQISIKNLPLTSKTYQTPLLKEKPIGTTGADHNVGQIDNNIYKVRRLLEKTGFVDKVSDTDLRSGVPSTALKMIHHLIFRASERFTQHIQEKYHVHQDLKFLPDQQFYKSVCLILCDMFGYRADLTPEQFFDKGFAERKLIMILNIYDILKSTRKNIKINAKLARVEAGAPHATDEAIKEYQIVNHRENVAKNMLFKINTQMQRRQLTVVEQVQLGNGEVAESEEQTEERGYVPLRSNLMQSQMTNSSAGGSSVYSLSAHHDKKLRRKHLKKVKSPEVEVIHEEGVESEHAPAQLQSEEQQTKQINVFRTMDQQQQSQHLRNKSAPDDGELEALQMLTGCMSEISSKYDKMANRFERKIEMLESTSKNLAEKFEKMQSDKK